MGIRTIVLAFVFCAAALPASATPYADFNAGIAAHNQERCDLAVARMTSALAAPDLLASLKLPARMVRAECRIRDKDYAAALIDLDAAVALTPDDYDAHHYRAAVRMILKQTAGAEDDYTALVRLRPDLSGSHIALGQFYVVQKRYEEAEQQYTTLIDIDALAGYLLRSRAYTMQGDFTRALADADYMVGAGPKLPLTHMARAFVHEVHGDFPDALSDMNAALDAGDEDDAGIEREKGTLLWKMGRFPDAGDAFRRATRRDPKDGYAAMWLTLVRLAENEPDRDIASRAAAIDATAWPAPLVAVYAGQSTSEAALKAAADRDPDDHDRNVCESDFYIGMWDVLHNAQDAGRALLQQAATSCPFDYPEGQAAAIQLKRMP